MILRIVAGDKDKEERCERSRDPTGVPVATNSSTISLKITAERSSRPHIFLISDDIGNDVLPLFNLF